MKSSVVTTKRKPPVFDILKVNLSRPFVLTFTEPILWFWDAYIAVSFILTQSYNSLRKLT
jgi:hypothetical protein